MNQNKNPQNPTEIVAILTRELKAFEDSAAFCKQKGLVRFGMYSAGVADAYRMCLALIRTTFNLAESGDVLLTWIVKGAQTRNMEEIKPRKISEN